MNLLAHFYITRHDEDLTVGNFLGDFVKGRKYQDYPEGISHGITIHREIDRYTDLHPIHKMSKRRLGERYGHYAGVAIDMFYDHILALNWASYADMPLSVFSQEIYKILHSQNKVLPSSAQRVLKYMSDYDWLLRYQDIEGIEQSLAGISRRTSFKSNLEMASKDLKAYFQEFENDFIEFFPQLNSHIKTTFDL